MNFEFAEVGINWGITVGWGFCAQLPRGIRSKSCAYQFEFLSPCVGFFTVFIATFYGLFFYCLTGHSKGKKCATVESLACVNCFNLKPTGDF